MSENDHNRFLQEAFDALRDNICVIDTQGNIVFVNASWVTFGCLNGLGMERHEWFGKNYLEVCIASSGKESDSNDVFSGIYRIINQELDMFEYEYPCHSPTQRRWFNVSMKAMYFNSTTYIVVSHHDITRRKLVEEQLLVLARTDTLTGVDNRTAFEQSFAVAWEQSRSNHTSICISMIDIDNFKLINDNFGHLLGDECLRIVGAAMQHCCMGELNCARYGGEEFLIFGSVALAYMNEKMTSLQLYVSEMVQKSPNFSTDFILTLSIGILEVTPSDVVSSRKAIDMTDSLLYQAKRNGKNCIVCGFIEHETLA